MSAWPPTTPIHIPGLCWIPEPTSGIHCTEHEDHENPLHFHCYTRTEWPRREGETQ